MCGVAVVCRTGVVIAALLLILGVPEDVVLKEFLLTKKAIEANMQGTLKAWAEAGGIVKYLGRDVDVDAVRRVLTGASAAAGEKKSGAGSGEAKAEAKAEVKAADAGAGAGAAAAAGGLATTAAASAGGKADSKL